MRCSVTLLRQSGLRLRPGELASPVEGELELTDYEGSSTFRRALRVANLWADTHSGSRRSLVVPLWDPVVIRINRDSLTLCGIELRAEGQRVSECVQLWRCTFPPSE